QLFASTDQGMIYCFGSESAQALVVAPTEFEGLIFRNAREELQTLSEAQASLLECATRRGYCLLLGAGEGRLAYQLAIRSELQIVCIEADERKVAKAREFLESTGLANRVTVHHLAFDSLPYADYLFNLVIDDRPAKERKSPKREEIQRVLRPHGGVAR